MDVGGLVAALASAQGTALARVAAVPAPEAAAPGFGTALARALGVPQPTPVSSDAVPASDVAAAQLRALLGALRGGPPERASTQRDGAAPAADVVAATGEKDDATEPADGPSQAMHGGEPQRTGAAPAAPRTIPAPTERTSEGGPTPKGDAEEKPAHAARAKETGRPVERVAAAEGPPTATPTPPPAKVEAGSTKTVERSLTSLEPQFRTRLERVVDRMRDELGLEVRVVETFRSQARQDALYAQGRTQPGPTVTWTRSSNHTLGLAADVRVEGADAPKAYAALAAMAAEEGLRTLGPDDPGHVELADDGAAPVRTTREDVRPSAPNGIARVATVAQPARVAQVAQVAHVAHVAQVSRSGVPGSRAVPVKDTQAVPQDEPKTMTERPREMRAEHGVARDAVVRTDTPMAAATTDAQPAKETSGPAPTQPTQGVDIAGRVARLMALRDATADAPATGVTLLLEGAEGTEARVRLGLRGTRVGATIDVADPAEAVKLGNRIGDLRRALERQGLEPAAVTVRDVPHVRELGEKAAHVTLAAATSGAQETPAGTRSGDAGSDRPSAQHRRDPGTAEDRPRRNPKEGRK